MDEVEVTLNLADTNRDNKFMEIDKWVIINTDAEHLGQETTTPLNYTNKCKP